MNWDWLHSAGKVSCFVCVLVRNPTFLLKVVRDLSEKSVAVVHLKAVVVSSVDLELMRRVIRNCDAN